MGKNEQQYRNLKTWILIFFGVIGIVWALLPEQIVFNSAGVCMHYRLLGVECPLCGMSRAAYCLLHFQIARAWSFNPMIFYIAWTYLLEWLTLTNIPHIFALRKINLWTGPGLILLLYGWRLGH